MKEALESVLMPQLTTLNDELSSANEAIQKLVMDIEHYASRAQRTQLTVESLEAAVHSQKLP